MEDSLRNWREFFSKQNVHILFNHFSQRFALIAGMLSKCVGPAYIFLLYTKYATSKSFCRCSGLLSVIRTVPLGQKHAVGARGDRSLGMKPL